MTARPGDAPRPPGPRVPRVPRPGWAVADAVRWLAIVAVGAALTAAAVAADARLGTAAAPFTGRWRLHVGPGTVLAPCVAAAVLAAVGRGWPERAAWRPLLLAGYGGALAWAVSLALVDGRAGLADPVATSGYAADVHAVGGDPLGFVRGFVGTSGSLSPATRDHPPAPVLLLWVLDRLGIRDPAAVGVVLAALGCLLVPFVTVAVRSLCGEMAARRLLPLLVLAPWAVWLAVSMDGVTAAVCAAGVACGVLAGEHGRRGREQAALAAASGLLVGVAALFGYAVAWLGVTVLGTYFVRRRQLLGPVTGVAALLPLWLFEVWGFSWPSGLRAAQHDFAVRVEPDRSWLLWAALDLLLLVIACGPAIVTAARGLRRTPGWPFVLGAGLAVVFAVASGLSRGEVERSWLPFYPWLLVPAVAPLRRGGAPVAVPVGLIGLGALTAIALEAVLRTSW